MDGSCARALAISTRRFMPPDRVMMRLSFLSQSERLRSVCSMWAGFGGRPNRPRLKLTVAQTVSKASVVSSWGTRPILARAARYSRRTSCPSAVMVPPLGVTMPQTAPISVVLPAPFGPSRAKISPFRMSRLTSRRAWKPDA